MFVQLLSQYMQLELYSGAGAVTSLQHAVDEAIDGAFDPAYCPSPPATNLLAFRNYEHLPPVSEDSNLKSVTHMSPGYTYQFKDVTKEEMKCLWMNPDWSGSVGYGIRYYGAIGVGTQLYAFASPYLKLESSQTDERRGVVGSVLEINCSLCMFKS